MRRALAAGLLVLGVASATWAQVAPLVPDPWRPPRLVLRRADWLALEPESLEELLRRVVGVSLGRSGAAGSPELVQIAGSGNGRVVVFVDGVDVSEPDLVWPRIAPVQLGLVDSIEVVRDSDPARIHLWTRRSTSQAPTVDFDVGRASLDTRTRRIQLFTPPRAVSVSVGYDEMKRSGDDFRPAGAEPAPGVGEMSARSNSIRIALERGADAVRVDYEESVDNSVASVYSNGDGTRTRRVRNGLRWTRSLGSGQLVLDLGHLAWDRAPRVDGVAIDRTDARTHAALDVGFPAVGAVQPSLRLRHAAIEADARAPDTVRAQFDVQDVVLAAGGITSAARWSLEAGAHRDSRSGATWSADGEIAVARSGWELGARAGRGVVSVGWTETQAAGPRTGTHAALRAGWRSPRGGVSIAGFGKDLAGGGTATGLVPDAGGSPSRVAGTWIEGQARGGFDSWRGRLDAGLAWMHVLRGPRGGLPEVQARITGQASRGFRREDLVVTLIGSLFFDGERRFGRGDVAGDAWADVGLDLVFIRRLTLFARYQNVTEARVETYPGVELPGRLFGVGVRATVFD